MILPHRALFLLSRSSVAEAWLWAGAVWYIFFSLIVWASFLMPLNMLEVPQMHIAAPVERVPLPQRHRTLEAVPLQVERIIKVTDAPLLSQLYQPYVFSYSPSSLIRHCEEWNDAATQYKISRVAGHVNPTFKTLSTPYLFLLDCFGPSGTSQGRMGELVFSGMQHIADNNIISVKSIKTAPTHHVPAPPLQPLASMPYAQAMLQQLWTPFTSALDGELGCCLYGFITEDPTRADQVFRNLATPGFNTPDTVAFIYDWLDQFCREKLADVIGHNGFRGILLNDWGNTWTALEIHEAALDVLRRAIPMPFQRMHLTPLEDAFTARIPDQFLSGAHADGTVDAPPHASFSFKGARAEDNALYQTLD